MLSRGRPIEPALFIPIAHAVAARIEGWDEKEFVHDPTKMSRGLEALYNAIGTDGIFTAAAAAMEAEAAGADLDWATYPPRVILPPLRNLSEALSLPAKLPAAARIEAALETTRRLAATWAEGPLLAAVVTGPWTLAGQLVGADRLKELGADNQERDICGQVCAELARLYCEAGAHMIVVHEQTKPPKDGGENGTGHPWREALVPLTNIVGFHKKLVVEITADDGDGGARIDGQGFAAHALPGDPSQWRMPPTPGSLLITASEVPSDADLPGLTGNCREMMTRLAPADPRPV